MQLPACSVGRSRSNRQGGQGASPAQPSPGCLLTRDPPARPGQHGARDNPVKWSVRPSGLLWRAPASRVLLPHRLLCLFLGGRIPARGLRRLNRGWGVGGSSLLLPARPGSLCSHASSVLGPWGSGARLGKKGAKPRAGPESQALPRGDRTCWSRPALAGQGGLDGTALSRANGGHAAPLQPLCCGPRGSCKAPKGDVQGGGCCTHG